MEFRGRVGTLEGSIVYSKSQACIKYYPNLYIKEYYGIFRSGLFSYFVATAKDIFEIDFLCMTM